MKIGWRWPRAATIAIALGAQASGCGNGDAPDERVPVPLASRLADAGPIPAFAQREGDPDGGREALLSKPYVSCGLPLEAWRAAGGEASGPSLPGRSGPAADLPYFNNLVTGPQGVEQVAGNCLTCHGAPLFGEIVIGLGNEFTDWTGDASAAVERAGALVRGEAQIAAWERYADRIAAIAPHIQMPTVGSNPANNLTFALIAHRDADSNAWSDRPLLPSPTTEPPPVSVPPWWRMKKKHAMFNMGEGRGDHARIMMAASVLCSDTREELEAIDAYAPDIRAFIYSLEAPAWPFALDASLVDQGRTLFETTCSGCHGHYGESEDYPNLLVPIETVATDPALIDQARRHGGPWFDWFNASYYGELSTAVPGPGYVAPPLDGIWATSPYLHNGSVPTLSLMLDSSARPGRWRKLARDGNDIDAFDRSAVGWQYTVVVDADAGDDDVSMSKFVYDTARYGHGNGGHRFGDHFSSVERAAVVEYLKTL